MDYHRLYKYICQFCFSIQIVWGLNEVTLLNPPEEPVSDYLLKVLYSCDKPSGVQLESVISFDSGITSTLVLRQWSCVPSSIKIRTLKLSLPDWLVFKADGIVPDSQWVLSCILRASVESSGSDVSEQAVLDQDVASLEPKPPLSRPLKQHQLCLPWSTQMLQINPQSSKTQCPLEKETVPLLSSIYASTGENFGITKMLDAHSSEVLEFLRFKAVSSPWCMFSIWILVSRHCQERMCGVFYHLDSHNNYITPALLLSRSGQLHVQMSGESGESSAFLCPFTVPLSQWCQVNLVLRGQIVTVSMMCIDEEQRTVHSTEHIFKHALVLDDTEGYFVIGGGKFIRGVEGFYGPVVYYRNRVPSYNMSEVVVPDLIETVNLTGWLKTCQRFHLELNVKISGYSLKAKQKAESESCMDVYHNWRVKDSHPLKRCELWEASVPQRRYAAKLAELLAFKHGGKGVSLAAVGRALYSLSLHKLGKASSLGVVSRILPLLLQAGCLADNQALHLSSVIYSAGLGVKKQPNKAWLLTLLAAQRDYRLALLHLGHLHHTGDHGVNQDPDLAYAYYANIAKQTALDRQNPSSQQATVESIYLNNEEMLNLQTNENHHIFHWLKLQARHGAAEAEQAIGRMLFWGQQGVTANIQKAVRHYERGAVQLEDPVSIYDYAIVLLQGHGVEKDVPRAVTLLKRAMDQGFAPAFNALAWYYEQYERDYERAVQLWEQADLRGSPDAAMNLGVMYSQGQYPGKAADQFMAYKYYLKSAGRGHISGAIHLADMWTTGIPGYVNRRPSDAVLWVKWAAEQNGYLGSVLQKALASYLKSDRLMSVLYYLIAAESGYAAGQFNVAYLCEQNTGSFLDAAFASDCMWRYYNLTIQSQNPDTYALIRVGDLLYEGQNEREKDLSSAAQMYKLAALREDPQGWYSLGLLAEEGYRLPLSLLIDLDLPELYLADDTLLLTTLYKRCRDSEGTESYLPCSLALFSVYLHSFQQDYSAAIKFCSAVAVAAAPPILLIILGVLRRRGLSLH
ncbi:protein sel-1 homolog 3 [Myripristis murdjan]|uniref:protein sel-1 homolog 3 n=1 Tax=Myripristis murdjan TaxID=586833 RepID=UPI001175ED9C|nr:protein sel-1 homolog 3-like [Myripristis murdjan]